MAQNKFLLGLSLQIKMQEPSDPSMSNSTHSVVTVPCMGMTKGYL